MNKLQATATGSIQVDATTQFDELDDHATWDRLTNTKISGLHPAIQSKARIFINRAQRTLGIKLRIDQHGGFRSFAEQDVEFAEGDSRARGGQSYHNYGLALDVYDVTDGSLRRVNSDVVTLGESLGFYWGGNFKALVDPPHFEMTFGHHWSELLKRVDTGQTTTDGWVNISP